MANFGYSRNEIMFAQLATAYGLVPNTSGIATLAASNCFRHIKVTMDSDSELYPNPVKTGSRDIIAGIAGRRIGEWSLEIPLQGNGAAGVVSDYDEILQAIFGAAPNIVASTSVTYALSDSVINFVLWRFRTPSTLFQQCGIGATIKNAKFNLGQNLATWTVSGELMWCLDSEQFATADTVSKGGLTAFPTAPASPVTNGVPAPGYLGVVSFTIAATPYIISSTGPSSTTGSLRTASLNIDINNDPVRDSFGTNYATGVLAGTRAVSGSFELYDSDGTDNVAIRAAAISKAPITFSGSVGTTPGNIWTFSANAGQAKFPKLKDDTARFGLTVDVTFHESSAGARNSIGLVCT